MMLEEADGFYSSEKVIEITLNNIRHLPTSGGTEKDGFQTSLQRTVSFSLFSSSVFCCINQESICGDNARNIQILLLKQSFLA